MTENEILEALLRREGGFVDHPADRGGATNYGITQARWSEYIGRPASTYEMQKITAHEAREFYRQEYVVRPNFHLIEDRPLRELVVDAGVHHGTRHAAKWLQWAAEVPQDGVVGPKTLAAVNAAAPLELFLWVVAFRIRLFGRLVSVDPTLQRAKAAGFRLQAEFAAGWNNRAAEFLEDAAKRIEALHNAEQRRLMA